jgi:endonuclease G
MNTKWFYCGTNPKGFEWKGGDTIHSEDGRLFEAHIGEPNFKNIWWLEKAIDASMKVARVKLKTGSATGFLIGSDIFITNNHVFEDKNDAKNAKLQFDYRLDADGNQIKTDIWYCDPDAMFKTNPSLDYTIVRVKSKKGVKVGDIRGYFDVKHGIEVSRGQRANIIQHPQGRFQQIAFRENQVKAVEDTFIQYITDTDYGTSGSPVFDDWFNVVALHNQRVRDPNNPSRWYRNQGFRIDEIVKDAGKLIP